MCFSCGVRQLANGLVFLLIAFLALRLPSLAENHDMLSPPGWSYFRLPEALLRTGAIEAYYQPHADRGFHENINLLILRQPHGSLRSATTVLGQNQLHYKVLRSTEGAGVSPPARSLLRN